MKHKVGDIVRIQSQEWIDAQEKKGADCWNKWPYFTEGMRQFAGCTAKITAVDEDHYHTDLLDPGWLWVDWMFDPEYTPDEPLSQEDAVRAMLDGETLYNRKGAAYTYSSERHWFYVNDTIIDRLFDFSVFADLYRRPEKRKRLMTPEEAVKWAVSNESLGWVVRSKPLNTWFFPRQFEYFGKMGLYERAELLPDLSGADESTIQGFEVEE
jgi:hypothetical protein